MSRGFYVSEKEATEIVEKMDKNKDGRVSFAEVSAVAEARPIRIRTGIQPHINLNLSLHQRPSLVEYQGFQASESAC